MSSLFPTPAPPRTPPQPPPLKKKKKQLKTVFLAYAAYGARRPSGSSASSSSSSAAASGTPIPAFPLPSGASAEIDGARFSKLIRAAGLLETSSASGKRGGGNRKLVPADVDLAFAQSCASSGTAAAPKKLRFEEFARALGALASRGGYDEGELTRAVASSGGPRPSVEATVPDFVRFHDDKVRKETKKRKEEGVFSLFFFRRFFDVVFIFHLLLPSRRLASENKNLKTETVDLHRSPRPRRPDQVRRRPRPGRALRPFRGRRARRELDLCQAALMFRLSFLLKKKKEKREARKGAAFVCVTPRKCSTLCVFFLFACVLSFYFFRGSTKRVSRG